MTRDPEALKGIELHAPAIPARLLMYRAAWLKDNGKNTTKESWMAKLFASEISVEVCEEAIQIHGGTPPP